MGANVIQVSALAALARLNSSSAKKRLGVVAWVAIPVALRLTARATTTKKILTIKAGRLLCPDRDDELGRGDDSGDDSGDDMAERATHGGPAVRASQYGDDAAAGCVVGEAGVLV